MSEQTAVYEIDLTKKYILQFDRPVSMEEAERIKAKIAEWKVSDEPFLFIAGGEIKLVRVEGDNERRIEIPTHYSSGQ
jgi:hypothetical protein